MRMGIKCYKLFILWWLHKHPSCRINGGWLVVNERNALKRNLDTLSLFYRLQVENNRTFFFIYIYNILTDILDQRVGYFH